MSASALANVLFVDDDANLRSALSRSLRNERFRQIWAESAEAASRALAAEPIDVVVADDRMPGLSGAELVTAIAKHDPTIVTVLFSGQPSIGSLALALNSGHIYHLLLKPCHIDEIVAVVLKSIAKRRSNQRAIMLEQLARAMAANILNTEVHKLVIDDSWMHTVQRKLNIHL